MSSENYQLYKKHKHEIFEMLLDTASCMGLVENQDEYLEKKKIEIRERLIEMGFKLKE